MSKRTLRWLTAVLGRLLYFLIACVLVVASMLTLEHGLPPALRSRLGSSSQAAHLHQTDEGTWTTYGESDGLVSDYVMSMAVDREGNLWFGTNNGVSVFDGENWTTYGTSDGLAKKFVDAIAVDCEGNKWFGTMGGLSKFDGTNWTTYNFTLEHVSAIAIDQECNIWFGTCLSYGYGYLVRFDGENGTIWEDGCITAIAVDNSGNVWVGTTTDGVIKFDGVTWTIYNTSNSGLASNYVQSIAIDSANVKWFGGCTGECNEWSDIFICNAAAVSRFAGANWTTYIAGESGLVGRKQEHRF